MREGTVRSGGVIEANSADEIRVLAFDALYCSEDDANIAEVDPSISIEVIHPSVVVTVDVDVSGVAELMTAVACAAAFITKCKIVLRRSES